MNASLSRARAMVPAFTGVQPDPGIAQALAMIGIGELLELILAELHQQNAATAATQRQATATRTRRRPSLTLDDDR